MMLLRGVRGAISVDANTPEAILQATREVLEGMIKANDMNEDMVASILFTATPDLNATYPAKAAREMGWTRVALMGYQEMDVPGGMPLVIRVLIHWNTDKPIDEIQHVYLKEAQALRPDIVTVRGEN